MSKEFLRFLILLFDNHFNQRERERKNSFLIFYHFNIEMNTIKANEWLLSSSNHMYNDRWMMTSSTIYTCLIFQLRCPSVYLLDDRVKSILVHMHLDYLHLTDQCMYINRRIFEMDILLTDRRLPIVHFRILSLLFFLFCSLQFSARKEEREKKKSSERCRAD